MDVFLEYLRAFVCGGILCAIGQILIDRTPLTPAKILVLYVVSGVVLGGLGNIWGSILATVILYVLPEALRQFSDYRMLVYAIVLILVMLATNNPQVRTLISRIIPRRKGAALDE